MEKEQIIKALEWCSNVQLCCLCPVGKERGFPNSIHDCGQALMENALALIKQQDEQIFQLENRLKECENGYAGTLHLERNKLHDAEEKVKELTVDNETLTIKCNAWHLAAERVGEEIQVIKADTVREIFKEIYSSLDYIEEQMEPEEIPECFFSVREDIDALKEKFESGGAVDEI